MNCNGCFNRMVCKSTGFRHCDGKKWNSSTEETIRDLMSPRYTAYQMRDRIAYWHPQKLYREIQRPVAPYNQEKLMVLCEMCNQKGIPVPKWLQAKLGIN